VPFRRLRLLLLAAAAGLSLASCSGGSPLGAFGAGGHAPNAHDAAFVRSITEHEKATVRITQLAERRALRRELRGIARKMTAEQQDELSRLGSLAQPRGGGGRATRAPPGAARPPATALADLTRVKDAPSFDYEFMRTMIEQNQAAIAIAQNEARLGSDPEVKRLAAAIESSRKRELAQIRSWLHIWYGGDIQPGPPALTPPGGGGSSGHKPSPGPPPPDNRPRTPL
jgi:uncharacterized protein (DUF305 family)